MPKPVRHVLVCSQNRPLNHPRGACAHHGAAAVAQKFSEVFQARNLWATYLLTQTACIGPCNLGPNIIVYPEGVMYNSVKPEDVEEIIDSHLIGGTPVERLLAPASVW
ncbi:ferredoxin [Plasticicumulans acidivorans]|uniref:(2Fe-2S) ferredoxin n=1 Tax=Plasticicumulans acidivorans TaxID=886464 RepID=A0A317MTJ6_9GAMM|nr:ferredoxin [Plasticicumulans acidivorans]PWV60618.1 (2Fe-2S) ferredoxin [Plasticicumulans acidivorans]